MRYTLYFEKDGEPLTADELTFTLDEHQQLETRFALALARFRDKYPDASIERGDVTVRLVPWHRAMDDSIA